MNVRLSFLLYFHQDNVVSDLTNAIPGNDDLVVTAQQSPEFTGAGNHQRCEAAITWVKFHVNGTAQTPAGACVDDFLLLQLT